MTFHLAIPSRDLEESKKFYVELGAKVGRSYPTHVVMDFYGCQLVCHLHKSVIRPQMYPRHFGIIVDNGQELLNAWNRTKDRLAVFEEYFTRHPGKFEEHWTFFLKDPTGNTIEFKAYKNREAIFS